MEIVLIGQVGDMTTFELLLCKSFEPPNKKVVDYWKFKVVDGKDITATSGYEAIQYACKWLKTPSIKGSPNYLIRIAKADKYRPGEYRYYCAIFQKNGDYLKVDDKGEYSISPKTGRKLYSPVKKETIAKRR